MSSFPSPSYDDVGDGAPLSPEGGNVPEEDAASAAAGGGGVGPPSPGATSPSGGGGDDASSPAVHPPPPPRPKPPKRDPRRPKRPYRIRNPLRPKRALSAYNLFFRFERERLVRLTATERGEQDDALDRWCAPSKGRSTTRSGKRVHRKTHGAIGFAELGKRISEAWKNLGDEERAPFLRGAEEEKERYRRQLKEAEFQPPPEPTPMPPPDPPRGAVWKDGEYRPEFRDVYGEVPPTMARGGHRQGQTQEEGAASAEYYYGRDNHRRGGYYYEDDDRGGRPDRAAAPLPPPQDKYSPIGYVPPPPAGPGHSPGYSPAYSSQNHPPAYHPDYQRPPPGMPLENQNGKGKGILRNGTYSRSSGPHQQHHQHQQQQSQQHHSHHPPQHKQPQHHVAHSFAPPSPHPARYYDPPGRSRSPGVPQPPHPSVAPVPGAAPAPHPPTDLGTTGPRRRDDEGEERANDHGAPPPLSPPLAGRHGLDSDVEGWEPVSPREFAFQCEVCEDAVFATFGECAEHEARCARERDAGRAFGRSRGGRKRGRGDDGEEEERRTAEAVVALLEAPIEC
ncbi:hypothetical protein ACHAWF_002041 [Thalassiosira exigua]